MTKRILSVLLAALLCVAIFAGCAGGTTSSVSTDTSSASTDTGSTTADEKDPLGADFEGYPIDTDEELSYYMFVSYAYAVPDGVSRNDNYWNQKLSEKTGVAIDWIEVPAGGDASQAFNLMLSGNDLPDMFYQNGICGSVGDLMDTNVVLPLNDYLETYAPDYYAFAQSDDAINKALKDDQGRYYGFMFMREDLSLGSYAGPMIRQDLLDKLGLDMPETIEDWDTVLRAFKADGVKYPLGVRSENASCLFIIFQSAYAVSESMYVDTDTSTVMYGRAGDGYKEFAKQMATWYADGLIDPDALSADSTALESKLLNSEIGACQSTGGTNFDYVKKLETAGNTTVEITAAPYPVLNEGDSPYMIQGETYNTGVGACITTACENVELACRFLNYGYTEEGIIFSSYGIEGESFEFNDEGVPVYTESFLSDERGNNYMMQVYTGMRGNCATLQPITVKAGRSDIQNNSQDTWYVKEALAPILPGSITLTAEESQSIATKHTNVNTYAAEMWGKFLIGTVDVEAEWDNYIAELDNLGLQDVLAVYQAAYDRYLAR